MKSFKDLHTTIILSYFVIVIAITMMSQNPIWVLSSFSFSSLYYIQNHSLKAYLKYLLYFIPMLFFIIFMNSFFNGLGLTVLFYLGKGNPITLESVLFGLFNGLLLCSIYLWFSSYQKVISTDAWITVLGRRMPTVGLAIAMIMKYIPDTLKQGEQISYQQKALLANEKMTVKQKSSFGARLLTILLSWSMENSLDTADSMAAKGYPSIQRKAYQQHRRTRRDHLILIGLLIIFFLHMIFLIQGNSKFTYYPFLIWQGKEQGNLLNYLSIASLICVYAFPLTLDCLQSIQWFFLRKKENCNLSSEKGGIVIYE